MNVVSGIVWSRPIWEVTGICAGAMLLLGVWMSWRRHSLLADIEEAVKNVKLSPEQAWRKVRFVNAAPQVVIVLGVLLMVAAVVVYAQQ